MDVPHLLQSIGGERGSKPAATVKHYFVLFIWYHRLDVAFDDPLAQMPGSSGTIFCKFMIFANINKMEWLPSI